MLAPCIARRSWFLAAALALAAGVAQASSLVAYYPLDAGSGTSASDLANGHTGTLVNGPTWTTGPFGAALDFSRSAPSIQLVDVPNNASIDSFSNMSVSLWFDTTSWVASDQAMLINKDVNSGFYWQYYSGINALGLWLDGALMGQVGTPGVGTWHHLVYTYDGATVLGTLDGTLMFSHARTGAVTVSTGDLAFGAGSSSNYRYDGALSEVAIWNAALTTTQISQVAAGDFSAWGIASPVPEPATAGLAAIAFLLLGGLRRRRA